MMSNDLRHQSRIVIVQWKVLENKFCCISFIPLASWQQDAHDNFSNWYPLTGSFFKNKAFQICRLIGWHMSVLHWQHSLRVIACNIHESVESERLLLSPLVPPLTLLHLCLVDTLSRLCLAAFWVEATFFLTFLFLSDFLSFPCWEE